MERSLIVLRDKETLFNENGEICGTISEITPELLMKLGFTVAKFATRIAVGYSDCTMSKLLASAFITGAASSGAQVTEVDASIFAVASYIARSYLFNITLFIENDKSCFRIRMVDKYGLPIERDVQRKIDSHYKNHDVFRAGVSDVVMPKRITGSREVFASAVAKRGDTDTFSVSVLGKGLASQILRNVLTLSGFEVVPNLSGKIAFSVSSDGMKLSVRDEKDIWHDEMHTDALMALIHFLSGKTSLAIEYDAPGILEQIASEFDGRVLRIGRDHGARETFLSQSVLCDAFEGAVALCSYLSENDAELSKLSKRLPEFTLVSRVVNLKSDRKRILRELTDTDDGLHKEASGTLRVCTDGGWVNIRPSQLKYALCITGEAANEEIASELCNLFVEKARSFDDEI